MLHTHRQSLTRAATLAAKVAVTGGLLAFVLRGTSPSSLWGTFSRVQLPWLVGALGMHALMAVVSVWRWRVLLHAQQVRVSTLTLSESFWVAMFFNNFLPSNIGGDVVRIADTARPAGSRTVATMVVLVDRVLGLFALLSVGALGALAARAAGIDLPGTIWLAAAAVAALGVCLLLFVLPVPPELLLRPLRVMRHPWLDAKAGMLEDILARFRQHRPALLSALAGAVVVQLVIVAFYALTAWSLSVPLPWVMAGVLVPVAMAVQMIPISINGFGVREAVFAFFFVQFGLGREAAVAVSLLGTLLVMLFSLGGGALFLVRRH
jgi:glycosyltransferase 2 family protein